MLDIPQNPYIVGLDEVDGDAFSAESPGTADTVDVQLAIIRQVVVDDERHLLNVDASRPQIGRDEDSAVERNANYSRDRVRSRLISYGIESSPLAGAKFSHDGVSLFLRHVAVHRVDGEVGFPHLLRQPVHLAFRIAKDDRLSYGQRVVEVAQSVELPLFAFDGDEELLQIFQRQFVTETETNSQMCNVM